MSDPKKPAQRELQRVADRGQHLVSNGHANLQAEAAICLLKQAGYHAVELSNGGYVVIDLANMSTTAECRDLSELMDLSQERKEEIMVPQRLAPKEGWPNDRTLTEIPMAPAKPSMA